MAHVLPQALDGRVLVGGVRAPGVPCAAAREGDTEDIIEEDGKSGRQGAEGHTRGGGPASR